MSLAPPCKHEVSVKQRFNLLTVLFLVLFVLGSTVAHATTKEWTNGAASGVWNDAGNWSPSGVPTSGDSVLFNATSSDNCSLDVSPSLQALIIDASYGGTLSLNAETLTLAHAFKVQGSSSLDAGTSTIDVNSNIGLFELASTQPLYNLTITTANTTRYNNGGAYSDLVVLNDFHLVNTNFLGCGISCTKHINVYGDVTSDDTDGWNATGSLALVGTANQQVLGSGIFTQFIVDKTSGVVSLGSFSGGFGPYSGGYCRLATSNSATLDLGGANVTAYVFQLQGGTISGSGTLNGSLVCSSGSVLSPGGNSAGCITVNGDLTMQSGSTLRIDVQGVTPCSLHDQLVVNGSVNLNNPTLSGGNMAQTVSPVTIISNDDSDAINGSFSSLADGSTATLSGRDYTINYALSSNNDVVLTTINQAPVANCGYVQRYISSACAPATVNPEDLNNGSYDPEGGPITLTMSQSGPFVAGFYFIDLTVTDSLGASSTCLAFIEVVDTVPPVIVTPCPANITVCGEQAVTWTEPVAIEADNCGLYTYRTSNPGDVFSVGTTTVLYQFEDEMGNNRHCLFDITVLPLPDVSISQSQISGTCQDAKLLTAFVSNASTLAAPLHYMWTGPLSANTQSIQATLNGTYMVTVTDAADCYSTAAVTLVVDVTAPQPSLSSLPDINAQCSVSITTAPTASDDCNGLINGTTTDPLSYNTQGTYTITWTYTDVNGNSTSQIQTVHVADTDAPVPSLSSLPDVVAECSTVVSTIPTASDNCSGLINATTNDALSYSTQGTYTIVWHYTDAVGNTASQIQTVIVDDQSAPVPTTQNLPTINAQCSATVSTVPTASDNCAGLVQGTTADPLSYSSLGNHVITWTYDDGNGNTISQQQTVNVVDNTAPVPTQTSLATISGSCGITITNIPTASDDCAGVITATTTSPLSYSTVGTHTIVWTYNDGNGNSATQNQMVIVSDNTAPVPSVSSLPTLTAQCSLTISSAPTASDNCAGLITGTTSGPLSYTTQGTRTITWTYNDGNGNVSTQTQTIIIQDNTAPVPNQSVLPTINGQCSVVITTRPTASDNCSGTITATTTNPLSYTAQGTYTITWRYTDAQGNQSTQTQTVVVLDNTPPTPNVTNLPTVTSNCSAYVGYRPYATDNCGGCNNSGTSVRATTNSPTSFSTAGTYTIVWVYTDARGNTTTQNQTVVVVDNSAPVPNQSVLPTINRQCNYTVGYPRPSATDNCRGTITGTPSQYNFTSQGTYTLVWTYNDGNGNVTTQNQTVVIQDTTRPTMSCRGSSNSSAYSVGLNANGQLTLNSSMATSMVHYVSDNCSGTPSLSIVSGQTSFDCSNVGQLYTLGLMATDAAGNTSTCACIIRITPGSGNDDDCDGVPDACDEAPGGNDAVDNNNDGLPDCKYPPAYANIKTSWKCGNSKVWVWYRNNSSHTPTCIQYSALQSLINSNQVWLGGASYCCSGKLAGQDQDIPYGVWQSDETERLFVWPNPANHSLNLMLVGMEHEQKTVRLVDLLGATVFTTTLDASSSELNMDLSTLNLSNGSYTVQVESATTRISTQVVIIH